MKRFKIDHLTQYSFSEVVQLLPHTLRLRPREGHELRIESSKLDITPFAKVHWRRDAESNSVATAIFNSRSKTLDFHSQVVIQQYDLDPFDFMAVSLASDFPFIYGEEERVLLSPYMNGAWNGSNPALLGWVSRVWEKSENIQTIELLLRLNACIYESIQYQIREEEGVQSAENTIERCSGSCRDTANLFMSAARQLGFAARFVSGYIYSKFAENGIGSTHAWSEVFIPEAGWKGFDPSNGIMVGANHFAVAVSRMPESIPPIAGNFYGLPGASMSVNVRVSELC